MAISGGISQAIDGMKGRATHDAAVEVTLIVSAAGRHDMQILANAGRA